jgi:hypothetical protein
MLMPTFIFLFFYLVPGIQSYVPTNPGGIQVIGKEFPISTLQLIQGANPQFDGPKK